MYLSRNISRLVAAAALSAAPALASESAADLLSMVPGDSVAVVSIRWSEIRASEVYQRCEERFLFKHHDLDIDEFVKLTGLDPKRDIDRIVVAVRGTPESQSTRGAVAFVSGRFDEDRLVGAITEQGGKLERRSEGSARVYRVAERAGADRAPVLAFSSPTLMLFGDAASVTAALDAAAGRGQRLTAGSELRRAFESSRHDGHAWGAVALEMVLPQIASRGKNKPATFAALSALKWASFDVGFGREVDIVLRGAAPSVDDAELVRQAVDGVIAMSRLGAKEQPDVLAALAETQVTRDGEMVTVRALLPADLLDRLHGGHEAEAAGSRAR